MKRIYLTRKDVKIKKDELLLLVDKLHPQSRVEVSSEDDYLALEIWDNDICRIQIVYENNSLFFSFIILGYDFPMEFFLFPGKVDSIFNYTYQEKLKLGELEAFFEFQENTKARTLRLADKEEEKIFYSKAKNKKGFLIKHLISYFEKDWIEFKKKERNSRLRVQLEESKRQFQEMDTQLSLALEEGIRLETEKTELQKELEDSENARKYLTMMLGKKKHDSNEKAVLLYTIEEFYPEEVHDLIISILEEEKARKPVGIGNRMRRYHIIEALLEKNIKSDGARELRKILENTLSKEKNYSQKMKSRLEAVGFTIEQRGGHPSLYFRGDRRYFFTLPFSASDARSNKNLLSEIEMALGIKG